MKIVIVGLGVTGSYLAEIFQKENYDLVLIESDEKVCSAARERLDAQIVEGDGASSLVLEPIIDEDIDVFIAVTSSDEVNVVSTLIARKFGAKRAITRISDPSDIIHPLLTDDPQVYVLNQEMIVAKDLARLVGNPTADEIEFFAKGKAEMVKLHVSKKAQILNQPLKDVKMPSSWLLVGTIRDSQFEIASGNSKLNPDDQALFIGKVDKQQELETLLGIQSAHVKRVIIVGYNEISTKIARTLEERDIEVRLIEEDKEASEEAAAELDDILVFHGDITSEEILQQAGIDETDYMLALTDDDENNILISLLAKEKGVSRVIALTHKPQYKRIIEKIGIDSVVNPRSAMVDEIFRRVHKEHFSEINILEDGQGQMMEVQVKENSKLLDKPLKKVKLPDGMIIGAILRDEELIIPHGSDKIQEDDHVVVFSTKSALTDVKKLFGS